MRRTTYIAYNDNRVRTSLTCDEARRMLRVHLGPVHTTAWNCVYSESHKGWFRDTCHVKTSLEKVMEDDFWRTPGGVLLAIFIAAVCCFAIWWGSLCYRSRKLVNVCEGLQEIDLDRRLHYSAKWKRSKKRGGRYTDDSDDDDIQVYDNGNQESTRVVVRNDARNDTTA